MFQSPHQGVSEEEWRTVAVIFRLSCNILTTPPHAEGQSSPTHSLISGVRYLLLPVHPICVPSLALSVLEEP